MHHRTVVFLASCILAAACGKTNDDASGAQTNGPGNGELGVTVDQPTAGSTTGASFSLSVSFTTQTSCATMSIGACTVNPCYGSLMSGSGTDPLPTAGAVTFTGPGQGPATASLQVTPQDDGNYAIENVVDALPWSKGGDALTFAWASFPGNAKQPGDSFSLSSPPYIALTPASAFASATSSLTRTQDLLIAWTSDTAATELDEVSFNVSSASVQVYCLFDTVAGQGAVPSAALGHLQAGAATYSIVSKNHMYESIDDGDGAWGMNFNVNAIARRSDGLAKGAITIQ